MTDPSDAYPSLTVLGGDQAGACFVLEEAVDNVLIGSDPSCRFHLPVPGVSPVHARIWIDDTGITVYDTSSPEGVYVNDDRVVGQTRLRNGDVIWLGSPGGPTSVLIQCRIPPRDKAASPAAAEAQPMEAGPVVAEPVLAEPVVEATPAPEPAPGPQPAPPVEPTGQEFEDDLGETAALPRPPQPPVAAPPTPAPPPPAAAPPPPPRPAAPPAAPQAQPPASPPPAPSARPQPRPAPRPGAVPVRPATSRAPAPRPRGGSGGGKGLMLGLVAIVVIALGAGGFFAYKRFSGKPQQVAAQPTPAPPTAAPAPAAAELPPIPDETVDDTAPGDEGVEVTNAGEEPDAIEEIIPVETTPSPAATPTPTPKPTPTPRKATPTPTPAQTTQPASQPASRVPELLSRASQAYSARRFDEAASLYDQALAEEPGNAQARAGKSEAAAAAASAAKGFSPGRTSVRPPGGGGKADLSGFDTSDVKVAKAPDYSGLVEYKVSPSRVVPGDAFSIAVTLTNDGKKPYRIQAVAVTTKVNGQASRDASAGPPNELRPKASVQVAKSSGTWAADTKSWSLEVVVTTDHGDVFTSRLYWR